MNAHLGFIRLALAVLLISAGSALAGTVERAAQSFAEGHALLAKGGFAEALRAYAAAAKTDPDNEKYRQQYSLLRRVMKMRKSIDKERNPEKWETTALALRSFYYGNRLHTEALALDQKVHARLNTAESAAMLAETQVELGMNAEAIALLKELSEEKASFHTRVLLGIALAREKQVEEAKGLADSCKIPDKAGPGIIHDLARLRTALLGDHDTALALLARCFESTPPSRLEAFKEYTKECNDLSTLVASADFAKVLSTPSKVKESSCSSGTSCGACPSRASCSSKAAKSSTKPKDDH